VVGLDDQAWETVPEEQPQKCTKLGLPVHFQRELGSRQSMLSDSFDFKK